MSISPNLGDDFIYGYCTSDDPHFDPGSHYNFFDASAYCVVDNNFAEPIFSNHTALQNLQVTAAHEFFHAVQFSYDAVRGPMVPRGDRDMDGGRALRRRQRQPPVSVLRPTGKAAVPLDRRAPSSQTDFHVYGDWIFFRYLTEKYSPALVKTIWKNADASEDTDGPGGPDGIGRDDFSVQAVGRALSHKGGFRSRFAEFGWRNRVARLTYGEGTANAYPQSPLTSSANKLGANNRTRSKSVRLKHQTNAYFEFKRGSGLSSTAKLKLVLNLPAKSTGAAASVLVFNKNGTRLALHARDHVGRGRHVQGPVRLERAQGRRRSHQRQHALQELYVLRGTHPVRLQRWQGSGRRPGVQGHCEGLIKRHGLLPGGP